MLVAITSDIHFFPHWVDPIGRLARLLQERQPDVLILAGDTGEPLNMFNEGLAIFKGVAELRAAVAGNHDVWHRALDHTSERLWETLLEKTARRHGYVWLERESLYLGDLGIAGTLAWYDYGGRHPRLNFNDTYYEHLKPRLSNDGLYVDWPWSDRDFASRIGAEFMLRLDALEQDPQVQDVLVVTHVPLFTQCLKPPYVLEQGLLNAYYANVSLGEQVLQRGKVRMVVSGHVHLERRLEIARQNGHVPSSQARPLRVLTVPADYGHPAALLIDTNTWEVEVVRSTERPPRRTGPLG